MAAHATRSSSYVHSGDTVRCARAFCAAIDTTESGSVPVETLKAALEQRGMSAAALEAFFDACPRQVDDAITLDEFLVGKRLPGMVEIFSSVSSSCGAGAEAAVVPSATATVTCSGTAAGPSGASVPPAVASVPSAAVAAGCSMVDSMVVVAAAGGLATCSSSSHELSSCPS